MTALLPLLPMVIGTMAVIIAVFTWVKTKRIAMPLAVITSSMILVFLADWLTPAGGKTVGKLGGDSSGASDPAATPTPDASPTPTADPAGPDASPPPWEWIGFGALVLVVIAVLVVAVLLAIRGFKRAAVKRRAALRKAIERKNLHERHREAWDVLREREKALGAQWLQYEDSLELSLRYPVMRDLTDPKVAAVVDAMGRAKGYRRDEPSDLDVNPAETEYAKAVNAFEAALRAARAYALKTRWNKFAPQEQKKAQQALDLLARALDTSNFPAERKTAYERVARIMEDLMIPVSPRALLTIEESVGRLELTA